MAAGSATHAIIMSAAWMPGVILVKASVVSISANIDLNYQMASGHSGRIILETTLKAR
jgi:hypothetical protein